MIDDSASPKKIVLGVTGGIAAYKSAELVRLLKERGDRVQVVMTRHAQEFIRPMTFAALSGEKVITDLFSGSGSEETLQSAIEHIGVAQEADLLLVAPATADILARFSHGTAGDFLTTMYLAFTGPVVVAPAMNTNMWNHPATRKNVEALRDRGVRVVDPDEGSLACGMIGPGRLADLNLILAAVDDTFRSARDLAGETVLITAGPTQEPVDPVRFLSNRSSGRMGFALAEEAMARGARVTVVNGPVALSPPAGCEIVRVTTAAEMHEAVIRQLRESTIVVMAAAVADYRPASAGATKVKKQSAGWSLELEPTSDILADVARRKDEQLLIGFAAETEDLRQNAERKLRSKNCDLLVANLVGPAAEDGGFDSEMNQGLLLAANGEAIELPRGSKREMAKRIFDRALQLRPSLEKARVIPSVPSVVNG